jgi:5-methylcytosine-specific restriction endonuclease McrA
MAAKNNTEDQELDRAPRPKTRKKYTGALGSWYQNQYKKQKGKCFYCGLSEEQAEELFDIGWRAGEPLTKRGRGWHLEIDRKAPNNSYDDESNLVLACYWCNNAKTDTFTHAEFKKVGAVFKEIWQKRLAKNQSRARKE